MSKSIPSFAHMNVAIVDEHGKITGQYPAKNEIQVRDLLNQASGLGENGCWLNILEVAKRHWKLLSENYVSCQASVNISAESFMSGVNTVIWRRN